MEAYTVLTGGRYGDRRGFGRIYPDARYGKRGFGQAYHHAPVHTGTPSITATDIENEVADRGYVVQTVTHHAPVVHHAPPQVELTRSMAIKIAVDMGIEQIGLPRTREHLYRCPQGTCAVSQTYYNTLISWCVTVANGLITGQYSVPAWAKSMMNAGTLRGLGYGGGHLGGWLQDNTWVIESIGDTVKNYGEFLTAKNVEDAIKQVEKNTKGSLSKDDIPALVAALTAGGYIDPNKQAVAAEGAMAATPSWMMPVMIGGAVLLAVMLMGRK